VRVFWWLSYHPTNNLLYGVSETSEVVSIDPITGMVNIVNIPELPMGTVASTWMTSQGEFIIGYNESQALYQIDLMNNTAVLIGNTGDSALNADGANCIQAPSPLDSLSNMAAFAFRNINTVMTDERVYINYETVNEAQHAFYLLEYAGFYRIKYVEADGEYQYSEVIPVVFKQANTRHFIVQPNPFINEMTINFIEPLAQDATIMVANSLGKVMENRLAKQGVNRLSIDCANYLSGFYTVYVKVKGKRPIAYRMLKVE